MKISGGIDLLEDNLRKQLSAYWTGLDLNKVCCGIPVALQKMNKCLNALSQTNRYVWRDEEVFFSPMYSVQYSIYLYFLSKALQKVWGGIETDAVYYLNKVMHSIDWFYGIDLPDIFYE